MSVPDRFRIANDLKLFQHVDMSKFLNTDTVIERILANRQKMQAVYERKRVKEQNYIKESEEWRKDMIEI
jgi:hypothetical protein